MERTDCPGGRKGEAYPEEHQQGPGFPSLLHREKRSAQVALAKGQGQKLNFQSLPGQGLGKLLLSGSRPRDGWYSLRYSLPVMLTAGQKK